MGGLNIFKVLADEQRREILEMLKDGRLSAGEIADRLGVTPAALSYHLKLLREADLVVEYKSKNYVFFENTNLLEKDEEYLILAFVPFEEGNLVINNKYTYIKLSSNSQTKNVTNNIIDDYKEAYKKEEIPSDKMNSFKSKYEIT
jgi:DNA-binding transcriptional ArsR family regulator